MKNILVLLSLLIASNSFAGKIQNEDVKSVADLIGAGSTAAHLINDTKIYTTALGFNTTLDQVIANNLVINGTNTYSSTHTALLNETTIIFTGGAWTLTLPTAVGHSGKFYDLIYSTSQAFGQAYTIQPFGGQTVGGVSSTTINTPAEALKIFSDGSNWQILNRSSSTAWVSGGSVNWSTNTSSSVLWRRVGDSMEVQVKVSLSGAPNNATLELTLPLSVTINTSKLAALTSTGNGGQALGNGFTTQGSSGISYSLTITPASTTQLFFVLDYGVGATAYIATTVPFTYANNDSVTAIFTVPISGWN